MLADYRLIAARPMKNGVTSLMKEKWDNKKNEALLNNAKILYVLRVAVQLEPGLASPAACQMSGLAWGFSQGVG